MNFVLFNEMDQGLSFENIFKNTGKWEKNTGKVVVVVSCCFWTPPPPSKTSEVCFNSVLGESMNKRLPQEVH